MWVKWNFWLILAALFIVSSIFFLPFSTVRFGGLFLGTLGTCCLAQGVLTAKSSKHHFAHVFSRIGRILFVLFCVSFVCIQGMIIQGKQADPQAEEADYVLVLGARIMPTRPSATLIERCRTAADFLREHPNATAILCGGQGANEPMPEAHMMRDYMVETLGVDADRLLLEDASRNTIQNIQNAKELYDLEHHPCAVISSDFHLARARRLMVHAGLDPYGIPAPMPDVPLIEAASHMREYCSILGLLITGRYF